LVVVAARVVGRLARVRYETRATRVARLLDVHLSSPRMKFRATVHARRGVARRGAESPTARGVTTTSRVAAEDFFRPTIHVSSAPKRPFGPTCAFCRDRISTTQTVDSGVNRLDPKISHADAERSPPSVARCCVGTGVRELALIVPEGRKKRGTRVAGRTSSRRRSRGSGIMGVVTRGMGDMGAVARAGAVSLSVARVPGVEVAGELETRALFSTPARVGGRAVLGTAGGMDAAAAAGKRKALEDPSSVEKNKKTCRRASDAPQTDVADIPVRPRATRPRSPLILPPFFSLLPSPVSLSREWPFGGGPPLTRRPHLSPRPAQDDVLEVVFGHLARISTPKEYFNAMLTCVRHPRRARFFHPRLELRPTCGSRGLLTRHRPSRPGRHPRKRHPRD